MKLARHLAVLSALIAAAFIIAAGNSALNADDFAKIGTIGQSPWPVLELLSSGLIWAVWGLGFIVLSILLHAFGTRQVPGQDRSASD